MYTIIREMNEDQVRSVFPLIQLLNPRMNEVLYNDLISQMLTQPYRMLGVYEEGKCIAVSGYWILTKLYSGRYLEMDNVVVDENYRSRNIGRLICEELERIASANGCRVIMLDAYLENTRAHEFYERQGFEARGYHFVKKIS